MFITHLTEERINRILAYVLEDIRHDEEWIESFPSVLGYEQFLPESIEEAISHPNALYGDDHVIATYAIRYPFFLEKMQEIVEAMIFTNINWKRRDIDLEIEQPGICFPRELALHKYNYIGLYANFLLSLKADSSIIHISYDIVRIILKWGWNKETYFLLLSYWFFYDNAKYDVLNHLYKNGFVIDINKNDSNEYNDFAHALYLFFQQSKVSNKKLQKQDSILFEELLEKYIFPFEPTKIEHMKKYFSDLIENVNNEPDLSKIEISIIQENENFLNIIEELKDELEEDTIKTI